MFCITHLFPKKKSSSKDDLGKCAMFIILWLLCSYTPASSELSLTVRTILPPEGAKTLVLPVQVGLLKYFTKAWNCSKY